MIVLMINFNFTVMNKFLFFFSNFLFYTNYNCFYPNFLF